MSRRLPLRIRVWFVRYAQGGALPLAVIAVAILVYAAFSYVQAGPHLGRAAGFRAAVAASYGLVCFLVSRWKGGGGTRMVILFLGAVLAALPFLAPAARAASDVVTYVSYGAIIFGHGGNPYLDTMASFAGDPLVSQASIWIRTPAPYGPVFLHISAFLMAVGSHLSLTVHGHVVLYRLVNLAFHLGTGAALILLMRARGRDGAGAAALYLFNPLLLLQLIEHAHNDAIMTCLSVVGLFFGFSGRARLGMAFVTAAALVKIFAWPVAILYFVAMVRSSPPPIRVRRGVELAAVSALIVVAAFWRFQADPMTIWNAISNQGRVARSLASVALREWRSDLWRPPFFEGTPRDAVRLYSLTFTALCGAIAAWHSRRLSKAVNSLGWFLLFFFTIGAYYFWHWYVTILVAIALAGTSLPLKAAAVAFSLLLLDRWGLATPVRELVLFLTPVGIALAGVAAQRAGRLGPGEDARKEEAGADPASAPRST